MVDYYLDPLASGDADGTSWANAWATMQDAHDGTSGVAPTVGDIVYCRGTETITAQVDYNAASGSSLDYVRWVGCNSGGEVDGTRYVLDADINACNGIRGTTNKLSYVSIENFEITTSGNGSCYGISSNSASDTYGTRLLNCHIHNWGGSSAVYLGSTGSNYAFRWTIIKCNISDNSFDGLVGGKDLTVVGSTFSGNGSGGAREMESSVFYNCLFYENDGVGADDSVINHYINCVFDDNNYGASVDSYTLASSFIGCRFSNNSIADIRVRYGLCNLFGCYIGVGAVPPIGGNGIGTSGNYSLIDLEGNSDWNEIAGSDTDGGYVDSASDNYNLTADATGRSMRLEL